ncbi:MAG: glycosyltransferase [Nitrospirae bacterium]|nr:glycosyltransferase [Nitrospirota bacterium]
MELLDEYASALAALHLDDPGRLAGCPRFLEAWNEAKRAATVAQRWHDLLESLAGALTGDDADGHDAASARASLLNLTALGQSGLLPEEPRVRLGQCVAGVRGKRPEDDAALLCDAWLSLAAGGENGSPEELLARLHSHPDAGEPDVTWHPPNSGPSPVLSLLVPTLNRLPGLTRLLDSLSACSSLPFEALVLENACTDGTPAWLSERRPRSAELGVANAARPISTVRAYNFLANRSRGAIIGILADDLEAMPGWDAPVADALTTKRYAGAVEPLLLRSDGTLQHLGGCIPYASHFRAVVNQHAYSPALSGRRPEATDLPRVPVAIEGATFPFLRREVFKRIGGYDPTYFHWWSDYDASLRLRESGLKILLHPASRLIDHQMISSGRSPHTDGQLLARFFLRLMASPEGAFETLAAIDAPDTRSFHDILTFECRWRAYRVAPCTGRSRP